MPLWVQTDRRVCRLRGGLGASRASTARRSRPRYRTRRTPRPCKSPPWSSWAIPRQALRRGQLAARLASRGRLGSGRRFAARRFAARAAGRRRSRGPFRVSRGPPRGSGTGSRARPCGRRGTTRSESPAPRTCTWPRPRRGGRRGGPPFLRALCGRASARRPPPRSRTPTPRRTRLSNPGCSTRGRKARPRCAGGKCRRRGRRSGPTRGPSPRAAT
mmetsp:Transcript_35249/g.79551  ORF Transcript_35249/g.79551 Transcript_35249/m.79551 type:complete len:216 (+) Transcript_35249:296-943(+)